MRGEDEVVPVQGDHTDGERRHRTDKRLSRQFDVMREMFGIDLIIHYKLKHSSIVIVLTVYRGRCTMYD